MGINKDIYEKLFDSQGKTSELAEEYKTIQSLKKEYINGERNRKELSKEIINKINAILPIIQSFTIDMQNIKEAVSCVDEISDSSKLYDILIKLSNSGNTQYGIKRINIIPYDHASGTDEKSGFHAKIGIFEAVWHLCDKICV